MRLAISNSKNSNSVNAGSAGNQRREAIGISGNVYDFSYMAISSDSADAALGDKHCALSMNNNVSRTSNNIDDRSAAEKMFAKGNNSNFKFSVYFTSDQAEQAIKANNKLERRVKYELESLKNMEITKYNASTEDMLKMAAVRVAKRILASRGFSNITNAEWERAIAAAGCKARQYGINTFELSVRASTRDESLKTGFANAWGTTEAGYEAATYNSAGTKTLPLFTEEQVRAAKEISEYIYNEFKPMYMYALSNAADFKGIFDVFCEVCDTIDSKIPIDWKCKYNIWTNDQKDKIDKMANNLADIIIGG